MIILLYLYLTVVESPCSAEPCQNGAACFVSAESTSYLCLCMPGWEGDECDMAIDACDPNPCFNGATCNDLQSSFTCTCPDGFGGASCETGMSSYEL